MRPGPPGGAARARARGGVGPSLLLDVHTPFGEVFYWSDRRLKNIEPAIYAGMDKPVSLIKSVSWDLASELATIVFARPTRYIDSCAVTLSAFTTALFLNDVAGTITFPNPADRTTVYFAPEAALSHADLAYTLDAGTATLIPPTLVTYEPWLVSTASFTFNRSLQTDTGSLALQNMSGDVLQTDFTRIARRSVLEGSLFVLRYYSVDQEWTWLEQHGTLTVGDVGMTVPLQLQQLLSGSDDTPVQTVSETCQLVWGEKRCGATGDTECLYTYGSCQVIERFTGIQTGFETNNPATAAALPVQIINRKRAW